MTYRARLKGGGQVALPDFSLANRHAFFPITVPYNVVRGETHVYDGKVESKWWAMPQGHRASRPTGPVQYRTREGKMDRWR